MIYGGMLTSCPSHRCSVLFFYSRVPVFYLLLSSVYSWTLDVIMCWPSASYVLLSDCFLSAWVNGSGITAIEYDVPRCMEFNTLDLGI